MSSSARQFSGDPHDLTEMATRFPVRPIVFCCLIFVTSIWAFTWRVWFDLTWLLFLSFKLPCALQLLNEGYVTTLIFFFSTNDIPWFLGTAVVEYGVFFLEDRSQN